MTTTPQHPTPALSPVPKMPAGLVELMEGLTREVLRNNPTEIYAFCANHMEKLLELRDGKPLKKELTLEEKIKIAQDKVRQRAKERQERYDYLLNNPDALVAEECAVNIDDNPRHDKYLSLLKAPVRHDLGQSQEVEISHETSNKIEYKITNTENTIKIEISEPMDSLTDPISEEKQELKEESLLVPSHVDSKSATMSSIAESDENLNPTEEKIANTYELDDNMKTEKSETAEASADQNVKEIESVPVDEASTDIKVESNDENPSSEIKDSTENIGAETADNTNVNGAEIHEVTIVKENVSETQTKVGNDENKDVIEAEDAKSIETSTIQVDDKSCDDKTDGKDTHEDIASDENTDLKETLKPSEDIVDNDDKVSIGDSNEDDFKGEAGNNISITETMDFAKDVSSPILETGNNPDSKEAEIQDEGNVSDEQNIKVTVINRTIEPPQTSDKQNTENSTIEKELVSSESKAPDNTNETVEVEIKSDSQIDSNDGQESKVEELQDINKGLEQENTDTTSINKSESIENFNDDTSALESDFSKTDEDVSRIDNEHSPNTMDLETAAVTIQKVFRNFMCKSRNSTFDDTNNEEGTSLDEDSDKKEEYYAALNLPKERRNLGITRMDTVLQTVNEEKSLSLSTDDSSTLSSAATTIQAHVRGFLVRNRLFSNKTVSNNSANSNEVLEAEAEPKNKTILNIHIVPEESNYLSRDESLIASMDLSLDACSPPSSVNLHPMSCDIAERRKLLKREDAIQSVSPPSNNSGKLSEESVKDVFINDDENLGNNSNEDNKEQCHDSGMESEIISTDSTVTAATVIMNNEVDNAPDDIEVDNNQNKSTTLVSSDDSDVVTPFAVTPRSGISVESAKSPKLMHSGEFHDVVLPTKVIRSDTTVVSEFQNVMVYFLLWNHSYK